MQALIVFGVIILFSAIIGAVTQVLRKQQQAEQTKRAEARSVARTSGKETEIDRFLEEIDKSRRKKAGDAPPPPARKPAPAPVAVRRAPASPVAATIPVARALPAGPKRVDELPVAPILASMASTPRALAKPIAAAAAVRTPPKTEFAQQLAALLTSKNSVALGVVMQEVMGPPKSRQR